MRDSMNRSTRIVGSGIVLFIVASCFELASYAILRTVIQPRAGELMYRPPEGVSENAYRRYLEDRDPVLGWPSRRNGHQPRPAETFITSEEPCISLYGDSFVYADEVRDEEAWGNVLSVRLGCRVGNFGVGGYGTDQAYLRFKNNIKDQAPISVLGIFPYNILRNVNQYRFLLTGGETYGFKPRFVMDDGELRLVSIPTVGYEELESFFERPGRVLQNESFIPDSEYGPVQFSFPYSMSLIRLAMKERVTQWLFNRPSWTLFAQPRHPTQSMEITSAIASAFNEECGRRNKTCVVIIFPTPSSYDRFEKGHDLITRALMADLETNGVAVLDVTSGFAKSLKGRSYCELLTEPQSCTGHLNAHGNRVLAGVVFEFLRSADFWPTFKAAYVRSREDQVM